MLVLIALAIGGAAKALAEPATLTDVAGRTVTLPRPAERIVLGEARLAYGLLPILGPDFARVVTAWPNDFRINDAETFEAWRRVYPGLEAIPEIGNLYQGSFSLESALAARPDLILMPLGYLAQARDGGLLAKLEAAGVPVLFVDFRERPLDNAVPSLMLMGRATGRTERAQAMADFHVAEMAQVYQRIDGFKGARPRVFIERAAGNLDCCATWGSDSLGMLIDRAGGDNLGSRFLPGAFGSLSPEQVLQSRPEVVIVTGADWSRANPANTAVPLGAGADPAVLQARLAALMERPAYRDQPAVRAGRVHGLWHQFYISPYNFVVFQVIAKWLHPELFAELDPSETFRRFHERFLAVPYAEGYWVSLQPRS